MLNVPYGVSALNTAGATFPGAAPNALVTMATECVFHFQFVFIQCERINRGSLKSKLQSFVLNLFIICTG